MSDHRSKRQSEPIRAPSEPKTRSDKPDSELDKTQKSEMKRQSRNSSPIGVSCPDLDTPTKRARLSSPDNPPPSDSVSEAGSKVSEARVDATGCVLKVGQYFVTNLPYMQDKEEEVIVSTVEEESVESKLAIPCLQNFVIFTDTILII